MKPVLERTTVACASAVALLISGCSAAPLQGYANNRAGRASAAEMCESVRLFTRSSLDAAGLRRAWFLPFGSSEDGSVDFYAPMASKPADASSKAFYERRVGQLTHYLIAPEFAAALASCLSERDGYIRRSQAIAEATFRASFVDRKTKRLIEISAANNTTSVLIAGAAWKGDVEEALAYGR